MIDIHCHILHDMDDGARSLEESVAMCKMAVENNITKIVTTSHFMPGTLVKDYVAQRNERIKELRTELEIRKIPLEIVPGAEIYVSDEIFYVNEIEKLRIGETDYVLIEFDFIGLTANRIMRYVNEIRKSGVNVIIAHPERYKFFQDDYSIINMLRENGVMFQVNAGSLLGAFGHKEYKLARELCATNSAFFLASDAHSTHMRNNALLQMFGGFAQAVDSQQVGNMLDTFPQMLLNGEDMSGISSSPLKKRFFK